MSRLIRIALIGGVAAAAGALLVGGCPPAVNPAAQETDDGGNAVAGKDFVGQMKEADALIAIVTEGEEILAYICDAVEGGASRSGWYEGLLIDGEIEITPVIGTTHEGTGFGSIITAKLSGDVIEGALELEDGKRFPFTAELADPEGAAGLYADEDEDDDALISVIVSKDGEAKGLSRFRRTGWTRRVTLRRPPPPRSRRISVNLTRSTGTRITRDLVKRRRLPEVRKKVKPKPMPPPTGGLGTLMIQTSLKSTSANTTVVGYIRVEPRPDPIGVPTINLSAQFADPDAAKRIPMGLMLVRVVDSTGKLLSGQVIDDPLHDFFEVPHGLKGQEAFWTRSKQQVESFLVAVPNIKEARRVVFTRYTERGYARYAGVLDLKKDPVKKPLLREQALGTTYQLNEAEYNTVIDNGPPEQRFDLLILAEGYQDTNQQRDKFDQDVSELVASLWTIPFFAEIQAVINVHTAFLGSVDSGTSERGGNSPVDRDTVYHSYIDYNILPDGRVIRVTASGVTSAQTVAYFAPGNYGGGSIDSTVVLVNDPRRAGSGGTVMVITTFPDPTVFAHELGHVAALLADEYENEYNDAAVALALTRANISGPVDNRNDLKWIDLVDAGTPVPTIENNGTCIRSTLSLPPPPFMPEGTVGMFEGGGYMACGSFRPRRSCRMRRSSDEFCPVCLKELRETFEPFAGIQPDPNPGPDPEPDPNPPAHDIYVRDNSLDVGNVPSPHNVADPATGSRVRIWQSVDIKVDAPPPRSMNPATAPMRTRSPAWKTAFG